MKKSLIRLEGKSIIPRWETLVSPVLSAIPSSPSWTLEGPLPRLLPELQRIKDSVKCDALHSGKSHFFPKLLWPLLFFFG